MGSAVHGQHEAPLQRRHGCPREFLPRRNDRLQHPHTNGQPLGIHQGHKAKTMERHDHHGSSSQPATALT
ncbi:MAG: hypothetical protein TH68_08590 [Candidatus Synechococcus spongiarum 142]|uniref:Uncharacterized protein n=1 Tax=Candidatus Synechococcus spongiarum 142 TaxID=1608213 RepID=A0A6N3X773_9SYNE|nr:MAG: hypothetical protein TH68_08590 [Candidatus Synechococcus spongiarum 142]